MATNGKTTNLKKSVRLNTVEFKVKRNLKSISRIQKLSKTRIESSSRRFMKTLLLMKKKLRKSLKNTRLSLSTALIKNYLERHFN